MPTKKITTICIILTTSLLTACATNNPVQITGTPPSRSVYFSATNDAPTEELQAEEAGPTPFAVLHKQEFAGLGKFEPSDGVYLGAWLRPYTTFREFEGMVGRRHAVYVYEMHLGDEIPVNWLLQCMAVLATPLLIIHPPVETTIFYIDNTPPPTIPIETQIIALAQRLGALNLPMFVAFLPLGHGLDAGEYTTLFRYARGVFRDVAPLAAFTWVAPGTNATPSSAFFPGANAVDWVGVALFSERDEYGFAQDIIEVFEPFYRAFSGHHPIMILPLGVSHISSADYVFNLECASHELERVYSQLSTTFPRVGLIAYGDAFFMTAETSDGFSITLDKELTETYQHIIQDDHFITTLEKNTPAERSPRWVRSHFHGYYFDGQTYVDVRTLNNELRVNPPRSTTAINGRPFAEAGRIAGFDISTCEAHRIIFVE